jgi:hypothetical protein
MIDGIGHLSAVLAAMIVAGEYRPSRQSRTRSPWRAHHVPQSDNEGHRHSDRRRAEAPVVCLHNISLLGDDKAGRTTC